MNRLNLRWLGLEAASLVFSWTLVWFLIGLLIRMLALDPATQLAGPLADEATRRSFVTEFHLDQPLIIDAARRSVRMLVGDWGMSWRTRLPVSDILVPAALFSCVLAVASTLLSLIFCAVALGLAHRFLGPSRSKGTSRRSLTLWLAIAAIPSFVSAIWISASPAPDWLSLPRYGYISSGEAAWKSFVLPALCLALAGIGFGLPRLIAAIERIVCAPWFLHARAYGLTKAFGVLRLGQSILLPAVGDAFAQVLIVSVTGAVAVEHVFSLPGLGTVLVDAVQLGDVPVLMGVVAVATWVTFGALAIRALFSLATPRFMRLDATSHR